MLWNGGKIDTIIFIGGGALMVQCMECARALGFQTGAILSKRHAYELISDGQNLVEVLRVNNQPFVVVSDVEQVDPCVLFSNLGRVIALCFGSAWIFPDEIIQRFSVGMLNFNGIPIPRYLGGAHYTWQILNNHRRSGCYIQQITSKIDCGDILLGETFELTPSVNKPTDYFYENDIHGYKFLKNFLERLKEAISFKRLSFDKVNKDRLYFPRLLTRENGWIDWSWSGIEIVRFCSAFGAPYPGASTLYKGNRLFVKAAHLVVDCEHPNFHPFCVGLIARKTTDSITVIVRDGLLCITEWSFENMSSEFKEGERLYTEISQLSHALQYRPRI